MKTELTKQDIKNIACLAKVTLAASKREAYKKATSAYMEAKRLRSLSKKSKKLDRQELVLAGLLAGETVEEACSRVGYHGAPPQHRWYAGWFYLGVLDAVIKCECLDKATRGYLDGYRVGQVYSQIR